MAMERYKGTIPEERARIIDIQDSLIERYIARQEAVEADDQHRLQQLEAEIDELLREKESIEQWATL
jgi:hypothetical protein